EWLALLPYEVLCPLQLGGVLGVCREVPGHRTLLSGEGAIRRRSGRPSPAAKRPKIAAVCRLRNDLHILTWMSGCRQRDPPGDDATTFAPRPERDPGEAPARRASTSAATVSLARLFPAGR